jgi:transcriptional regulator with XRE-family HTH domain
MRVLRLKELMNNKGISREELAQRVNVSLTTISNISSEKNLPTLNLLLTIAEALDVDIREMFVSTKGGTLTQSEIVSSINLITDALSILKQREN